jgi:hypothetical protein
LEYRKYISGVTEEDLDYFQKQCPFARVFSDELSLFRNAVSEYPGSFWIIVDKEKKILFAERTSNTRSLEDVVASLPRERSRDSTDRDAFATISLGSYAPVSFARRVYTTADERFVAVVLDRANCVIVCELSTGVQRTVRLDSATKKSMIGLLTSTQVGSTDTLMILANAYDNYRLCIRFNMRTCQLDTIDVDDVLTDSVVNWSTRAAYSPRAQVVITSPFYLSQHRPLRDSDPLYVGLTVTRSSNDKKSRLMKYPVGIPGEYTVYSWTGLTNPAFRLADVESDVVYTWPANCESVYGWSPSNPSVYEEYALVNLPLHYRVYKKEFPYGADRDVMNSEYNLRSFPEDVLVSNDLIGVIWTNYTFSDTLTEGRQYAIGFGYHIQERLADNTWSVVAQGQLEENERLTFAAHGASMIRSHQEGKYLRVFRQSLRLQQKE